jgi:hypothetical protein
MVFACIRTYFYAMQSAETITILRSEYEQLQAQNLQLMR